MNKDTIVTDLNRLAVLEDRLAEIAGAYADLRALAIPEEVAAKLEEIAAEEAVALQVVEEHINEVKARIKTAALEHGETVKGDFRQVIVYTRRNVDLDGLLGFAVAEPRVMSFIDETRSISIRRVK